MPVHQLILLIIGATMLLIGGPWVGFLIARIRLRDQARVLDERERRLRAKQVENRRRFFEDSTALLHKEVTAAPASEWKEKLERKELELSLLREEKDLEIQNLRKQIERIEKRIAVAGQEETPDDFTYHKTPAPGIRPVDPALGSHKVPTLVVPRTPVAEERPDPVPAKPPAPPASDISVTPARTQEPRTSKPPPSVAGAPKPPPSVDGVPRRATLPSFQPVAEWISGSGNGDGGRPVDGPTRGAASPAGPHPASISEAELTQVRNIVHLPLSDFELLQDLGYASLSKLAHLSSGEIRRLTEIFGVPQEHISRKWISEARAHMSSDRSITY